MDLINFPRYFKKYSWSSRHALFGYPPDEYPNFVWIASLEERFRRSAELFRMSGGSSAPVYLIREMIHWGGAQNGVLQRFEDGLSSYNLSDAYRRLIEGLDDPETAISAALSIPGLGLTYASKLLRFMNPNAYASLDQRIRSISIRSVSNFSLPRIHDGHKKSMIKGYVAFLRQVKSLRSALIEQAISFPGSSSTMCSCSNWRVADVEMALFAWAGTEESISAREGTR